MGEKFKRIVRPATADERERHAEIREQVMQEFPPLDPPRRKPAVDGIGAQIRSAREAQGLTRFTLAKKAGISKSTIIRDIEYGCDGTLSDVRAVAEALGLQLALVEPAKT
jgi:ribosome-binding protein aMBF1 (putative translation factor)